MTSFLFWNVMRRDLRRLSAIAASERAVDVLLVAESGNDDDEWLQTLKEVTGWDYEAISWPSDRVRVFSRYPGSGWRRWLSDANNARVAIWTVNSEGSPQFVLAAAHLPSKSFASPSDQLLDAAKFANEICLVEDSVYHQRTVVVGDLNMNPYDEGVTAAWGLNAVMTRHLASRRTRVHRGRECRFLYNPMWGLFGDRTPGPPGTYYHRSASGIDPYWHSLDQVLLRPELMDRLTDLQVLDRIGAEPLISDGAGIPNVRIGSDHLPLAFRLHGERAT